MYEIKSIREFTKVIPQMQPRQAAAQGYRIKILRNVKALIIKYVFLHIYATNKISHD